MAVGKRKIKEAADAVRERAGESRAPINVRKIAQMLGLRVSFEPYKPDLSGVLIKSEGRAVIGVNSAHAVTRQRFTIAHEIGHHVLAHKGELFIDQTVRDRTVTIGRRDGRSSQGIDFQEIEANAFGAEILMPEDLVFAAVQKQLKASDEITSEELAKTLARQFEVSPEAMQHRLTNLGLFIPV